MNNFIFSQSVDGYLLAANARRLSPNTIRDYTTTFRKFQFFLDNDPPISEITSKHVKEFLASKHAISKKTLLNYHTGLSALWSWCVSEELVEEHILQKVRRPKPEKKDIQPYTQAEVKVMLSSLKQSKSYIRSGKRECSNRLTTADRNKAVIYMLLDTGVRAEELCSLRIHQVDVRNSRITVMGKGSKQCCIPFSSRTGQVLWRYLAQRSDDTAAEFLFLTIHGRKLTRSQLLHILVAIGKRSGVNGVNVHRFRHTFAINYLRNGGDPYTLQIMLGHSTMDMVKRYLSIAQADLDKSHKLASPVDNWRL